MQKCQFPDGMVIKPDGVNELDPCFYDDISLYRNVDVTVSQCRRCGNINISWQRTPDTIEIPLSEINEDSNDINDIISRSIKVVTVYRKLDTFLTNKYDAYYDAYNDSYFIIKQNDIGEIVEWIPVKKFLQAVSYDINYLFNYDFMHLSIDFYGWETKNGKVNFYCFNEIKEEV